MPMNIQKIPLQDRLRGLSRYYPAHPEYIPAILRNFAALPITAYLEEYPEDLERLADLVQYPAQYMSELSYQAVAVRVRDMYRLKVTDAGEASAILAKPLIAIYQLHLERRERNG